MNKKNDRNLMREFIKKRSAGGILLVASAVLAIVIINSPVGYLYEWIFEFLLLIVTVSALGWLAWCKRTVKRS